MDKSFDCIRLDDVTCTFTATFGNVATFQTTTTSDAKTRILIRNIKSPDGVIDINKLWLTTPKLIKIGKINFEKHFTFDATCQRSIYKRHSKPEMLIIFVHIENIKVVD